MEVVSAHYGNNKRESCVLTYTDWCSIDINEHQWASSMVSAVISLRFHKDNATDLLFFDQLRSVVEQVGKFLRP